MRRLQKIKCSAFTTALLCMVLWFTSAPASVASANVYSESAVKSAYLYRFTGYIDWPATEPRLRFTIAVLDDDEVAAELSLLLSTRSIKDLPVRIHKIKNIQELGDAQILYVGARCKEDLSKFLLNITTRPVLIVTNRTNALDAGSTINFLEADHRVRFEVSLVAAKHAGLKISPELLSVAVRVQDNRLRTDSNCTGAAAPDASDSRCIKAASAP